MDIKLELQMKMKKSCKSCLHYKEALVHPGYGDCNCVTSKYYGDAVSEDDNCIQFSDREVWKKSK